jgi:ankyrin repeat protein
VVKSKKEVLLQSPKVLPRNIEHADQGKGGVPAPPFRDNLILNMTKMIVLPYFGLLLRMLVTRAGYRGFITNRGLDKDLDDLANESRPGSMFELIQLIEDSCLAELVIDCGGEWAKLLDWAWIKNREAIQYLVQNVDTSPMANQQGKEHILRLFVIPMLSSFHRFLSDALQVGPDFELWWKSPFFAWIQYASLRTGLSTDTLFSNLETNLPSNRNVDRRSIERWVAGEPIGKLGWPYKPIVQGIIGKDAEKRLRAVELDRITGWLVVAVAFQSLPYDLRAEVQRDYKLRDQQAWSLSEAEAALNRLGFDYVKRPLRVAVSLLVSKLEELFAERQPNTMAIQNCLEDFKVLIESEPTGCQFLYQSISDRFSARLAAISSKEDEALRLYDKAVAGVWWLGGQFQHPILNEALLYAVGVGKKVSAEHYWDKTYLLGLNTAPKRQLDDQELRRIAFGFESLFFPLKAKAKIPPRTEYIVYDHKFSLTPQQLSSPNRKVKFAEGRTRRTLLMDAISKGNLDDVKKILDAGGDPNDYIKESGEGPLMYAMRRACDRKDPSIMEHLLSLDLLPTTVNRPASTKRETPLKIAIEMANANAVERLIDLGAKVEDACDYVPSALCFALLLLHGSLHRDDSTQEQLYLQGKSRGDVYDAKDGAVLDVDIAKRRQSIVNKNLSPRHQKIRDAVKEYFTRSPKDHRHVIKVLLRHGADANRRYKVEPHSPDEWTPTLFAAEIGDIEVFKMLIDNGGNPNFTLTESSALERFDALWVAIAYRRDTIVAYLRERLKENIN